MTLLKWSVPLSVVVLMAACSNPAEQAKDVLRSHLGEKLYLEFQNVQAFPDGAVCGEYRSNDPMRGSSRYRRFVVWDDTASDKPSKQDWAIFCSEDADAALQASFGIGPVSAAETGLPKIRDDLHSLQSALLQYQADNYMLPTREQGLAALATQPASQPQPVRYRTGGYIESLPSDPWGRPYGYEPSGLGGGVVQEFTLFTLGADGRPGGKGKNADVALAHLKYLDYVIPD